LVETGAGYEADLLESLLDGADIPVLRKGPESGIFGPGFAGASPLGVKLFVPESRVDEAREVIGEAA
ncbi:MAG: DUF2007 domain-containing protein, partial [Acidimicrobiia bacterium]|nr:DUF2007 domain-containing protein [Acidimicrobiia bacterium]